MTSILWVSLFLSILASLIFWFEGLSLGLNFFIYVVLFVLGLIYLLKKFNRVKSEKAKYLVIPIFILAATYFVYYNRFFNRWNLIVIPFLTLFMIQWMISGKFSFNLASSSTNSAFSNASYAKLHIPKSLKYSIALSDNVLSIS